MFIAFWSASLNFFFLSVYLLILIIMLIKLYEAAILSI